MIAPHQLAERLEGTRLGTWLDRLGPLSPLATLQTFSPGSRALLADAEANAERGLHVARGLLILVIASVELFALRLADHAPLWIPLVGGPLIAATWYLVWRILTRARPPWWAKYALILVDAYLSIRIAIAMQTPLYQELGIDRTLAPGDLVPMTAALLVFVAMSGSFRLDPRPAGFSTLCALVAWTWSASVIAVPPREAIGVGAVIWFAGMIGAQGARLFRHLALKAAEQAVLERYVPEALTRELARSGDPLHAGREVEITVLIVDIRGYTRRTENLSPSEAVAFLNDYFAVVVAPLAHGGAVLDKYIGDGVFSFFEGEGHAARAMRAAGEIVAAVDRHNAVRPEAQPLEIGIAMHSGRALVGTIGSEHKREYTAIADAVNVAARLEELNKRFGSRVVASEAVVAAAGWPEGYVGPNETQIRGREAAIAVYYLPRAEPLRN